MRYSVFPFLLLLLHLTPLALLAQDPTAPSAAEPAETPAPEAVELEGNLIPIPYPDIEALEPGVREQLTAAQSDLLSWLRREEIPAQRLAASLARLAQLFHAYSLYPAAEAAYRNTLLLEPDDFRWRYQLAHVLEKSGRLGEAVDAYHHALELRPDDLAANTRLGQALLELDRQDEAEDALWRALEIAPESPAVRAALGELALARGDYQNAAEQLSAVLEQVPAADRLHYPLAMAYRGLGEIELARQHLTRRGVVGVSVADPLIEGLEELATGERVHLQRGQRAFNAGQYEEAAKAFRDAVAADPSSARAYVNLGSALGQLGDVEGALAAYGEALRLDPGSVTIHFNLGVLLTRLGRHEQAIPHYRAAAAARPDDAEARLELARSLLHAGQTEASLEHFRAAVDLAPAHEGARIDEAAALSRLERYAESRQRLLEANEALPESGLIARELAQFLAGVPERDLRDGERALALAERVFEARNTPQHAAIVALALAELGRCAEAAELQKAARDALAESGDAAGAEALQERLERYLAGPPCS